MFLFHLSLRNITKGHTLFLLLTIAITCLIVHLNTTHLQIPRERIGTFSFGFGFSRSLPRDQEQPLLPQLWSLTGIILVASAFLIFTVLNLDITRRSREIARLRAIGFSRGQIASLMLLHGGILGLFGSILGLGSGILWTTIQERKLLIPSQEAILFTIGFSLLSAFVASLLPALRAARIPSILNERPPLRRIPWRIYLWLSVSGGLILLVLPGILTFPHFSQSQRLSLLALLGSVAFLAGLSLLLPPLLRVMELVFGPILALCLRIPAPLLRLSLTSNLPRNLITTIAFSIGFTLVTAIRIWSDSMLQMFRVPACVPSVFLRFQEGIASPDLTQYLAQLPLRECIPVSLAQPEIASPHREQLRDSGAMATNAILLGLDTLPRIPLKHGSFRTIQILFQQHAPVCIIPETLAKQCSLSLGDTINLHKETQRRRPKSPPSLDSVPLSLTIVGITTFPWAWFSKCAGIRVSAPRTAALLFVPYFLPIESFGGLPHEAFWLTPSPTLSEEQLESKIATIANNAAATFPSIPLSYSGGTKWDSRINQRHFQFISRKSLNDSLLNRSEKVIALMLRLPRTICILSLLLLFSIATTFLATRQKEFRLLHTCGFPPNGLRRLLLCEMLLFTATSLLLAFGAGLLFAAVCCKLADTATVFGVTAPPILIPWSKLLPFYLLAFGISSLSHYCPLKEAF